MVESYVSDWCDARPAVTVLSLGLFDVIFGEIGWTEECARRGNFSDYYLRCLDLFLDRARDYCRRACIDFEAWFSAHSFVALAIPNWFKMTVFMESPFTISVSAFDQLRGVCFRDMWPLQPHLWLRYRMVYFHPKMPTALIQELGDFFVLRPLYNRLYIAQVLDKVARLLCIRHVCRVPNDFREMRKHIFGCAVGDRGKCGRYWARFIPEDSTYLELHCAGDC